MLSYVLSLLFQSFWQIILSNDCNKPTVLKLHWKIKKVYEKYSLKISCWNNIFDVSGYYSVTILINAMPLSQYFFDFNKLLLYMYIHIYIYITIVLYYYCIYVLVSAVAVFKVHTCKCDLQENIILFDVSWHIYIKTLVHTQKEGSKVNITGTA